MNYWIFKTEPDEFSIEDLKKKGSTGELWDGIRNYQARNFLKDEVKKGDYLFIYHSSCKHIGIAGEAIVIDDAKVDKSAFDKKSSYYCQKSTEDNPLWYTVKVKWQKTYSELISLKQIKEQQELKNITLLTHKRLSISPLSKLEFQLIQSLQK